VDQSPHMKRVQIVLDKTLLQAADRAARRSKQNRSAWLREALREYLKRLEMLAGEAKDRQGYAKRPQKRDESVLWEGDAAWPAE